MVWYCIVLYCIVLYCIVLYCIVLCCIVYYHTIPYHTIQYNTIQYHTILNWPLSIGAFQGQWNTTDRTTTTTVKNPNCSEANQLAIYKRGREVEPGTTRNKFNEWLERVLSTERPDLRASWSVLTTGPHCLPVISNLPTSVSVRNFVHMTLPGILGSL